MDDDKLQQGDGIAGRHDAGRREAERAAEAARDGDGDRADAVFAEAARIDPEAAANALDQAVVGQAPDTARDVQDDDEIAAMSRTIEPGKAAPSRAGISGRGSGADDQGT